MNVDIFTLYIFSRYTRLSNIRENIYIVKITFTLSHRGSNIKNAKINLREIFGKAQKCIHAKIHSTYVYDEIHLSVC